jgi:hypothetical protein
MPLSAEEKPKVRAYAGNGHKAYIPISGMYARLLGLNNTAAYLRHTQDVFITIIEMKLMSDVVSKAVKEFQ